MEIAKITDGELHILNVLWENDEMTASDIVKHLKTAKNWNRNTTYTFINRLVEKGIIERKEPNFVCKPLFSREQVSLSESKSFLKRMFNGSLELMVASFVNSENLSPVELELIAKLVSKKEAVDND